MNISDCFFIIDSEKLEEVGSNLYGFIIQNNMLIENIEFVQNFNEGSDGAYVYVQRTQDKIVLYQDFIGSFGLYLYREGEYFALSNSFMHLVDYVKKKHKISMNMDCANFLITSKLCLVSYSATMINEITLLDRSAVVEIDVRERKFNVHYHDYKENTVELCSEEGMQILDNWYNKWIGIIRKLKEQTNNIQVDLSGGFDTRLILVLFLGAGIDLNDIFVYSIDDQLHTHSEDFQIASLLSEYYQFRLNDRSHLSSENIHNTLDDILAGSFLTKLGFHKQMHFHLNRYTQKRHFFSGSGGECIRSYWNISEEEFIQDNLKKCNKNSRINAEKFQKSAKKILSSSFQEIQEKFQRFGREVKPEDRTLNLYRETRCRNHFGKDNIENYCANSIKYSPLLDSELHQLKLNDEYCNDKNLLMAVIFERYCPELLKFPFQGDRIIDGNTLTYAGKINKKYPFVFQKAEYGKENRKVSEVEKCDIPKSEGLELTQDDVMEFIEKVFASDHVKQYITLLYNEELYDFFAKDIKKRKYHSLAYAYVAIAISKVAQDVSANIIMKSDSITDLLKNYVQEPESEWSYLVKEKMDDLQKIIVQQNKKNQELQQIADSTSYKVGKFIMTVPIWIKGIIYKLLGR